MAVQTYFCGQCGTRLLPGSTFCGRCGTLVTPPLAVATAPAYSYAPARPGASAGIKMSQVAIARALLLMLALASVGLRAFAVSRLVPPPPTCTVTCRPRLVTPLSESST